nr:NO-inducible flavohemoprotein [uncultured Deefgea sp.]
MLTESMRQLVKATVPVLKEHGVTLTTHFYARMFRHNPELKAMFNQGNQQAGTQQQALAMAVAAYAEHIDDPSVLMPVLKMVAHKHVSLGIRAEHYPIVGRHLLASIQEVLGDAASDELIAAWAVAYCLLADTLIRIENEFYGEVATQNGGWSGWRSFEVVKKVVESTEITSFYLQAVDGGQVPHYQPGQYISVRTFVPELGLMQARQYTLSDAPGTPYLRISVKKEAGQASTPAGMVSNQLHRAIHEGALLDIAPPMGDFVLNESSAAPLILISAGVGQTPMLAMLEHVLKAQPQREVRFIHACRHGAVHAFKERIHSLSAAHPQLQSRIYYENPRDEDRAGDDFHAAGRINVAELNEQWILPNAEYYLCGPSPFMQEHKTALKNRGVPAAALFSEVFGAGGFAQ